MSLRSESPLNLRWVFKDFTLKSVVCLTLAVAGLYYRQVNLVAVVSAKTEQRSTEEDRRDDEFEKAMQSQREIMRTKVDKQTYEADRARLSEQFQEIQLSLNTIQQVLMQHR